MIKKDHHQKRLLKNPARLVFLGVAAIVLVLGATFTAYAFNNGDKILPHTYVAGVSVGGLTKEKAAAKLTKNQQDFDSKTLKLTFEEESWQLLIKDLGLHFDNQASLDQAYDLGKKGSVIGQISSLAKSLVKKTYLATDLGSLSEDAQTHLSTSILNTIETQPAETSLDFKPGNVQIIEGKPGKKLDYTIFENDIYHSFETGNGTIQLHLTTFEPEVSTAQAEPARALAQTILATEWKLQAGTIVATYSPQTVASWLVVGVERVDGQATGLKLSLKSDLLKKQVTDFSKKANRSPVNAQLKSENGIVSVGIPEKDGQEVEIDPTVIALNNAILEGDAGTVIPAQVKMAKADLRADNLAELGIKELIGSASTDFSGSPTNRKHNIAVGQTALNGGFLKNGETYSTTGRLGPVDASTGYLPELVIKGNRTIPEDGGGLCQVSTTLFRAILDAGMPIVARTNHSYRVGYYERSVGPGLDATVYIPSPDLKWKNDSGNAIYIQSYIVGTKLTFELYGTKDSRVVTIDGPTIIENIPVGDPLYADTDTLYVGETKRLETAHAGARTTATYSVVKDGQQINRQVFNSYYKPWPAQYLRGTKPRPAA